MGERIRALKPVYEMTDEELIMGTDYLISKQMVRIANSGSELYRFHNARVMNLERVFTERDMWRKEE